MLYSNLINFSLFNLYLFLFLSLFVFFLSHYRNLFPPNIIQATMFQYRTQLELPPNATDLGNGTKIYLSALSPSERNHFTTGTLNLTHVAGREGLRDLFSIVLIGNCLGILEENNYKFNY